MGFSLYAFCLLSISYFVTAQSAAPSATQTLDSYNLTAIFATALPTTKSAFVDSSASDLGIFQIVTPTTHANQVAESALVALTTDVFSFYEAYTQVDPFDYIPALSLALKSEPTSRLQSLVGGPNLRLATLYYEARESLLSNPTSYLSRLHVSASPFPSDFSSSLASQASGILLGYESLVSQDILSISPSSGPITPGMIISLGPTVTAATSAGSSKTGALVQATGTATGSSPSEAAAVPQVTGSPVLMMNAAAAVVGILGVAMM